MLSHGVVGVVEEVAGVQKRLGRDAPDVEAGAAETASSLHASHLEAELRSLDCRDIAAGTASDDNEVLLLATSSGGGVTAGAQGAERRRGERESLGGFTGGEQRLHRGALFQIGCFLVYFWFLAHPPSPWMDGVEA